MKGIFRKKHAPPPPTFDECSEKLNNRSHTIESEISSIDEKLSRLVHSKSNIDKQRALQLLRRKRILTQQLNITENQQFNTNQMAFTQESINTAQSTVNAMKANMKTMNKQIRKLNINEMDGMMWDMEELMDDVNDINEILGGDIGEEFDEEELMEEFNAIEIEAPQTPLFTQSQESTEQIQL